MIVSALHDINLKIDHAARDDGRLRGDITLIAVSKKQPDERIEDALSAGLRIFGENRVQEAQMRWAGRRADYPDLKLHLIGPLQTNKSDDAVQLFDVIESLDREKLAVSLAKSMEKIGVSRECLIQVNTGEEDQKVSKFCNKDVKVWSIQEFILFHIFVIYIRYSYSTKYIILSY